MVDSFFPKASYEKTNINYVENYQKQHMLWFKSILGYLQKPKLTSNVTKCKLCREVKLTHNYVAKSKKKKACCDFTAFFPQG